MTVSSDQTDTTTDRMKSTKGTKFPKPGLLPADQFSLLFEAMSKRGYRVLGPTVQNGTVVLDEIHSAADLPAGWQDSQEGGTYRLVQKKARTFFGVTHSAQSWKRFLHSPTVCLWKAKLEGRDFQLEQTEEQPVKSAFLGVRSCELKAIEIQDKVLLESGFRDSYYRRRREATFIIAVNCVRAGGTCFCASMGTGPEVKSGFDLLLTEICTSSTHHFLVQAGSEAGAEVARELSLSPAAGEQIDEAHKCVASASRQMGRTLDTENLPEILFRHLEHPRFREVAARCLTCGNCTLVCPTCFCTTIEDVTDLSGKQAERWRKWDSCFTMDFSYIHGGSVRNGLGTRYRQWLTHKLASWHDQFGTSGCVGCGRCITWCPVGIDITEEATAIRAAESKVATLHKHKE